MKRQRLLKKQAGFAHLELLLLLMVLAMILATLWYVWHSKNEVNKAYSDLSNPTLSTKKKSTPKTNTTVKKAPVVNYTTSGVNGVALSSDTDLDKLEGASSDAKAFLKDKLNKNKTTPSPCGNAYGLFVKKIWNDKIILGGESHCKNTNKLWAKVSQQWTEIGSADQDFDCSILEQYQVPSSIVEHCMKNGQQVNNDVKEE